MDAAAIKESWANKGFSFGIWEDPPHQIWENYVHDVDEILMLAEGKIEITLAGKTFKLKLGEEILIPAGAQHTVHNIGEINNRWYYGYKHLKENAK